MLTIHLDFLAGLVRVLKDYALELGPYLGRLKGLFNSPMHGHASFNVQLDKLF